MNKIPSKSVVTKVRVLYGSDPLAAQLFDSLATRQRDATATNIEFLCRTLNVSRNDALELAHKLAATEAAEFYLGRRGGKTRLVWKYSCRSIGRAASGEDSELEQPENPITEEEEERLDAPPAPGSDMTAPGLTITEAKRLLAVSLGISESSIEISIKA